MTDESGVMVPGDAVGAAARAGELRAELNRANYLYYVEQAPDLVGRRVGRAVPGTAGDRGAVPGPADGRLSHAARRRAAVG